MRVVRSFVTLTLAVSLAGCGAAVSSETPPGSQGGSPGLAASPGPAGLPAARPSGSPGSEPTAAEFEQLVSQIVSAPIDVSDPGTGLDLADQGLKDLLRRTGGVAEALGPDGPAILAEIDVAERKEIAALVAKVNAQAARPGAGDELAVTTDLEAAALEATADPGVAMAAKAGTATAVDVARPGAMPIVAQFASIMTRALPGGTGQQPPGAGFEAFGSVAGLTLSAPDLFARAPRDAAGNAVLPTLSENTTSEHGATLSLTMRPTLTGSKLSADVEVVVKVAGPPAYVEKAKGKLSIELCPDESGAVALEVSLAGGFSLFGGGMQYDVAVSATGHVADTGRLAGFDVKSEGSLAAQPMTGDASLGTAPKYIQMRVDYSADPDGNQPENMTVRSTRWSSQVDMKFAQAALGYIRDLGHLAALFGMLAAEHLWTNGYCVAITVPEVTDTTYVDGVNGGRFEIPYKRVDAGSETPFTAVVSHKFEGQQLRVPVMATLAGGAVSVTPSGTKVVAPAPFRYKAPDELYQDAMVTLETSSRRGVATLSMKFRTVPASYRASWRDQGTVWSGVVCNLNEPFTVTVLNATGDLEMPFEFVPASSREGAVSFDVNKFGTRWTGAGSYTVQGSNAEQLRIVGQVDADYTTQAGHGHYPIPFNIPLTPLTTNECGQS